MDHSVPVTYRAEIAKKIMALQDAGESCSIVAVGSSGKSNLARHLVRPDVMDHYCQNSSLKKLGVMTNCTRLPTYPTSGVMHTLILESLFEALRTRPQYASQILQVKTYWQQAAGWEMNESQVRMNTEDAIRCVLDHPFQRLMIVLDDFDCFVQYAPAAALKSLRALRDNFKPKLTYVTLTRRELDFLRMSNEYHDFYELVTGETFAMGPYDRRDAKAMIVQLAKRFGLTNRLNQQEIERLIYLSGGHAGLIKAIIMVLWHEPDLTLIQSDVQNYLNRSKYIEPECEQIWLSLEAEEKKAFCDLIAKRSPSPDQLRPIVKKGLLIDHEQGSYVVFSPLFRYYVLRADKTP